MRHKSGGRSSNIKTNKNKKINLQRRGSNDVQDEQYCKYGCSRLVTGEENHAVDGGEQKERLGQEVVSGGWHSKQGCAWRVRNV
jgi:hypothetical protein